MSWRSSITIANVLLALCFGVGSVAAGSRFQAIAFESVPELPGLQVVTIRDNVSNACYTAFVTASTISREEAPRIEAIDIERAAAARDRRLAELSASYQSQVWTVTPGIPPPNTMQYDWEAQQAQTAFLLFALDQSFARIADRLAHALSGPHFNVVSSGPCPVK